MASINTRILLTDQNGTARYLKIRTFLDKLEITDELTNQIMTIALTTSVAGVNNGDQTAETLPLGSVWGVTAVNVKDGIAELSGELGVVGSVGYIIRTAEPMLPSATVLGNLATGILRNTIDTGELVIAVAADFPTLNQNTSGTAANLSGTPTLPNGTSATTQAVNDNTAKLATTAFVVAQIADDAPAETTTSIGSLINGATDKATPVDADYVGIVDSAASNILKKLSWSNIKATLKTYFDTLYQPLESIGTWTPAITFDTPGNLSVTYSAQVGKYTQIGKMFIADFNIVTSAFTFTTASGNLRITGLPVSSEATANHNSYGSVSWGGITKTGFTDVQVVMIAGNNYLRLNASGSGVAAANVTASDTPTGGTVRLIGSIVFMLP